MTTFDDIVNRYMKIVDRVVDSIPYDTKAWKEFFFNPKSVVRSDMKEFWPRMADLYVYEAIGVLIAIAMIIPSYLLGMFFLPAPDNEKLAALMPVLAVFGAAAGIVGTIGLSILFALVGPFITALYCGLEYLVAKAVGGLGNFKEHFNASVLPTLGAFVIALPITLVLIPLSWLESVPVLACCVAIVEIPLGIVTALIGLYSLYLKYKAFVEVHKTGQLSTIAIIFVPVLLLVALMLVLFVLFYAAMMALLVGVSTIGGA